MLSLQNPGETTRNVTEALILWSEVEGVFFEKVTFSSTPPLERLIGDLLQGGVGEEKRTTFVNEAWDEEKEKRH